LIVGGYAVMKYSEPRFTKDLDLWVNNSSSNSKRAFQALAAFGAPLKHDGITPETFTRENVVYQIGVAPVRIDILTSISGVSFGDAWTNRVPGAIFGVSVNFIALTDLMANKKAAGRSADLEHLAGLRKEPKQG